MTFKLSHCAIKSNRIHNLTLPFRGDSQAEFGFGIGLGFGFAFGYFIYFFFKLGVNLSCYKIKLLFKFYDTHTVNVSVCVCLAFVMIMSIKILRPWQENSRLVPLSKHNRTMSLWVSLIEFEFNKRVVQCTLSYMKLLTALYELYVLGERVASRPLYDMFHFNIYLFEIHCAIYFSSFCPIFLLMHKVLRFGHSTHPAQE